MILSDLVFGWVLSRLLAPPEARSPAVSFPPTGGGAPQPQPAQPQPGTRPPATTPGLPAPTFPTQVTPPATKPAADVKPGFKRAVEVWEIQPAMAAQANSVIVGAGFDPTVGAALTIQALEQQFPKGWRGKRSATPEETANAKALLPKWKNGGVIFMGPPTFTGRRAYRMTQHPASATPQTATPAPVSVPTTAPPAATVPASFPTPAAQPAPATRPPAATPAPSAPAPVVTTLPEVLITADAQPSTPIQQVTHVRKGEGLAQVAKRLGRPATQASAMELRAANVPGPDGFYSSQDLSKGGLKKAGRAGGLQPGDRLFVPPAWGSVDATRL